MITSGVNVLLIVNLDSDSGTACLKKATDRGRPDHRLRPPDARRRRHYYVSFDNVAVGTLMGEGLQKCLTDEGKTKANIAELNGSPTDNNATLFKQGYDEVLKPKFDSGDYKSSATRPAVGHHQGRHDLRADLHRRTAASRRRRLGERHDGRRHHRRLKANNLAGKVPVTGQDASVEGLQAILAGTSA